MGLLALVEKFRTPAFPIIEVVKKSILILDTVGDALSAGLFHQDKLKTLRLKGADASGEALLFKAVDRLLFGAGLNLTDLHVIVVSSGPGRFTGIRIGMTFAAVLSSQAQTCALAVSSLEALAFGTEGTHFCPVLPGYRGEKYYQSFRRKHSDAAPKAVSQPAWSSEEDWERKAAEIKANSFQIIEREPQTADFLKAALFYLKKNKIPKFEPLYLKAAGYEKRK